MQGLVDKEKPDRSKYIGSQPHPGNRGKHVLLDEFLSKIIQQKKDDEKDDGENQRHPDSSFPDNRTQRSPDEKHHQAGDGERELFMPGNPVKAQVVLLRIIQNRWLIQTDLYTIGLGNAAVQDTHAYAVGQQVCKRRRR